MENFDITLLQNIAYIFAAILFITGIKMLGKEATAQKGNIISAVGMFIAIIVTAINIVNPFVVLGGILLGAFIGSVIAVKVKMTSIPEMVALFNGFGGLATFFIAWSEMSNTNNNLFQYLLVILTIYIGGVTFSGSLIAFGKLSERLKIGKGHLLTNLFIFLAFYSSDLNDNQRIDSDGMIERTYYLEQYRQENQPSFSDAFRAARKELGPGKIFMWNNRYFTTNFYYETVIVIADEVVDINKENKTYASEETLGDVIAVRSYKDSDKYEINYTFLNKIAK